MKAYTDIEQSKKLAEILPMESADMRYDEYTSHIDGTPKVGYKEVDLEREMDKFYGVHRDKQGITRDIKDGEVCFDWKDDQLSNHEMRIAKHFYELGLKAQKGE